MTYDQLCFEYFTTFLISQYHSGTHKPYSKIWTKVKKFLCFLGPIGQKNFFAQNYSEWPKMQKKAKKILTKIFFVFRPPPPPRGWDPNQKLCVTSPGCYLTHSHRFRSPSMRPLGGEGRTDTHTHTDRQTMTNTKD